ncbi:BON domain-containing protein [uncultured Psychrobacter sp.]|uniref:BON domain-containing protein n=1 Tax=uncultured Psychrobacter sp. TaxID=259303 RepID=UPI00261285AE|nr:BON domain-containing protein [uncultured Psychrobacter sp.]
MSPLTALSNALSHQVSRQMCAKMMMTSLVMASLAITGCTTNYLTNSTNGTYGVPVTERTIPQRLLDRSIEHTAKINVYGLQQDLQQNSRMSIDSFNSEVLLSGEVPTEALKTQIEQVVKSMPDVRKVYNELNVSVARGYSSTVQDGYITSKLLAKVAASDGVKSSQLKAVTNNGVVYIMGRMTPTQQSNLIDIANDTAGITELVLFTTLVNDIGATISGEDIMTDPTLTNNVNVTIPQATAVIRTPAPVSTNSAIIEPTPDNAQPINAPVETPTAPRSSSPYIDLYQDQ